MRYYNFKVSLLQLSSLKYNLIIFLVVLLDLSLPFKTNYNRAIDNNNSNNIDNGFSNKCSTEIKTTRTNCGGLTNNGTTSNGTRKLGGLHPLSIEYLIGDEINDESTVRNDDRQQRQNFQSNDHPRSFQGGLANDQFGWGGLFATKELEATLNRNYSLPRAATNHHFVNSYSLNSQVGCESIGNDPNNIHLFNHLYQTLGNLKYTMANMEISFQNNISKKIFYKLFN